MTDLNRDDIAKIALLSRLELSDKEAEELGQELTQILHYVEQLREVDTDGVPVTSNVLDLNNITRPDELAKSFPIEKLAQNAPQFEDDQYVVPKVIG